MLDYSRYFARSFDLPDRNTKRVHVFSNSFDEEEFHQKYIEDTNEKFVDELKESYLGFFIIKPLNQSPLGRTLIKFPSTDLGTSLQVTANIFGQEFTIDTFPYQEQDRAVAACATTALWTTLGKLSELFDTNCQLCPAEVHSKATETMIGYKKKYPSSGLSILQIISFYKQLGLEVNYLDCNGKDSEIILGYIYSFLKLEIPIIAHIALKKGHIKEHHAVTLVGCDIKSNGDKNKANRINRIYIQDDVLGPFSKVKLSRSNPTSWRCRWNTENLPDRTSYNDVELIELITPVYNKLRVPFIPLYRHLSKTSQLRQQKDVADDFSIYRTTIQNYKKNVFDWKSEEKEEILTSNKPRFLWVFRFEIKDYVVDYIFDATHHWNPKNVEETVIGGYLYKK